VKKTVQPPSEKILATPMTTTLMLGMVEGRPALRCIDDGLMWCIKDMKDTVMMSEERENWRRFVAHTSTVLVDHGVT